ncbi:MAG: anthranilate synthase component I [marine actinobacterium MedAcidi-G2B]|nr:MAG: anthranilate synthase component I [marine actinobacterium MedAcidi-G2B]MDC0245840.1 anthranilate synthase component I [Acidimicrobiaceae bacterium]
MSSPDRQSFHDLAKNHSVIPVWRELLADLTTPVSLFARCVGEGEGFLLESVDRGESWGRWSFIGLNPLLTMTSRNQVIEVEGVLPEGVDTDNGMLKALEDLLERYQSPQIEGLPPLHGGLIGYLGYDVVREIEALPNAPEDDRGFPDAIMSIIGDLVAIDHWRQRAFLLVNVLLTEGSDQEEVNQAYDDALSRLDSLAAAGALPLDEPLMEPPSGQDEVPEVISTMTEDAYTAAVDAARDYILNGDIFQVVLSQRFDVELEAEAFDVYRVLRQINPSPYMYFLRYEEMTVVGASPEPMVQLLDNQVISRPIAGTRWRGRSENEDKRMASELLEDPKERAEHIMLVDLARNDLGRVVEFGTESVEELMILERYSHVMHLTSQVTGNLADGITPIDVLKATLPAGTVSGAPKVRAMEIIDELEPVKRGPYAGVVGYFDFSGNIDTAITIRTMLIKDGTASVQAGAGVVADSDPRLEYLECQNKAKALLVAIPSARRMTESRRKKNE